MGRTCCAHKLFFVLTFRTIFAHSMFSQCSKLVVFMYLTGKSMNNPLSYCGLVAPKISTSDKDLPLQFDKSSDIYQKAKLIGDTEINIPTQFVLSKNAKGRNSGEPPSPQTIHNIILKVMYLNFQLNCRLFLLELS